MNFHGGKNEAKLDENIKDFSVNINPFGVPNSVKNMIVDNIDNLVNYPSIKGDDYKEYILDIESNNIIANNFFLDVKKENIVVGNGATELIYLFSRSNHIKRAMLIEPTFSEYRRGLEINDIEVFSHILDHNDGFFVDVEAIKKEVIDKNIDCIFLCNPNNPSGGYINPLTIDKILRELRRAGREIKLFIDESFIEFCDKESSVHLINTYRVFILRSLTKSFGIPGLRIGYGIGSTDIIDKMEKKKEPWSVNYFALKSLEAMAKDKEYIYNLKEWISKERSFMMRELNKIEKIEVFNTYSNFILIKFDTKEDPYDMLLERGFYLRKCLDFNGLGSKFLRTSIKRHEENMELIEVLRDILK